MRIMSAKPLNAETPNEHLRSWITANPVFFDRNQGEIPQKLIPLSDWGLAVEGQVAKPLRFSFDEIYRMPSSLISPSRVKNTALILN